MAGFSLICSVVNLGDASKVIKISKKYGVKGATISIGRGTVCNSFMNFFAINDERKEIVSMVVEKELARDAIKGISAEMKFDKPHHGIAFLYDVCDFIGSKNSHHCTPSQTVVAELASVPVAAELASVQTQIHSVPERLGTTEVSPPPCKWGGKGGDLTAYETSEMSPTLQTKTEKIEPKNIKNQSGGKIMYNVIFVVVEKGRAEDVIEAANKVVSIGGTIINARGAGVHEVQKFFSLEIEPEKEEVFIITKRKNKDKIINSIRKHMRIDEPGNGILYVLDVNEVFGLHGVT